jgi:hypothetical protein
MDSFIRTSESAAGAGFWAKAGTEHATRTKTDEKTRVVR